MESQEKELTAEECIRTIHHMISLNKATLTDNSYYYLLWGWLSVFASVFNYVLLKTPVGKFSYFVWFLMPLVGWPLSFLYKKKHIERSETHLGYFIQNLWNGFGISSIIVFVLIGFVPIPIIFIYLLLFGTAIFIIGRVTKFKPLVYGAFFLWAGAITSIFCPNIPEQFLINALATTAGYLVPGYILRNQYQKNHV